MRSRALQILVFGLRRPSAPALGEKPKNRTLPHHGPGSPYVLSFLLPLPVPVATIAATATAAKYGV